MPLTFTKYYLSVLIVVLLTGCTITGEHYIRNLTGETIQVSLISTSSLDESQFTFNFSDQVVQVKRTSYKNMNLKITPEFLSPSEIKIDLPPTSTIHIGAGSNLDSYIFSHLIIHRENEKESINLKDSGKIKTKKAGLFRYVAYLDIN